MTFFKPVTALFAVLMLTLGLAACSDDTQDEMKDMYQDTKEAAADTVDSAEEKVEEAGDTLDEKFDKDESMTEKASEAAR